MVLLLINDNEALKVRLLLNECTQKGKMNASDKVRERSCAVVVSLGAGSAP